MNGGNPVSIGIGMDGNRFGWYPETLPLLDIIGASGVGKTELCKRIMEDSLKAGYMVALMGAYSYEYPGYEQSDRLLTGFSPDSILRLTETLSKQHAARIEILRRLNASDWRPAGFSPVIVVLDGWADIQPNDVFHLDSRRLQCCQSRIAALARASRVTGIHLVISGSNSVSRNQWLGTLPSGPAFQAGFSPIRILPSDGSRDHLALFGHGLKPFFFHPVSDLHRPVARQLIFDNTDETLEGAEA